MAWGLWAQTHNDGRGSVLDIYGMLILKDEHAIDVLKSGNTGHLWHDFHAIGVHATDVEHPSWYARWSFNHRVFIINPLINICGMDIYGMKIMPLMSDIATIQDIYGMLIFEDEHAIDVQNMTFVS